MLIESLIYYFNGNEIAESKYNLNLNKGILLIGKPGVGKSAIFQILKMYLKHITNNIRKSNLFRIESIESIKDEYKKSGNFNKYNLCGLYNRGLNLLINEFGVNYNEKIYGSNFQELFNSFLMRRYEIFVSYNKMTHATSNFDTVELSEIYDKVIIDRFKEMFNIIVLDGNSFRN